MDMAVSSVVFAATVILLSHPHLNITPTLAPLRAPFPSLSGLHACLFALASLLFAYNYFAPLLGLDAPLCCQDPRYGIPNGLAESSRRRPPGIHWPW